MPGQKGCEDFVLPDRPRLRLARAVLENMDAVKLDAVVYPSWNNPTH